MKIIGKLTLIVLALAGKLYALNNAYVTNNQGSVGTPGTFVSIVDLTSQMTIGYVDTTGFDLTHPIDIHFNEANTFAYVVSDSVSAVSVINVFENKVIGRVDDTAFPFVAPAVMGVSDDMSLPFETAYVTNEAGGSGNLGFVSIVDLNTNTVTGIVDGTLAPFDLPIGVAFNDSGTKAYVANFNGNSVSVIDPTIAGGSTTGYVTQGGFPFNEPTLVGWVGDTKAYVSNVGGGSGFVSVIDGTTNIVTGYVTVPGGFPPFVSPANILENPDLLEVYITDTGNGNIYVIDTTSDTVTSVLLGTFSYPLGLLIQGSTLYQINSGANTAGIVDLTTGMETGLINSTAFPFFAPYQFSESPNIPVPIPSGVRFLIGYQKTNRFATQSELYNTIIWGSSVSEGVVSYNVYSNGTLVASPTASGTLIYVEHDVPQGPTTYNVYTVTAVDSTNTEGYPTTIVIQ